jgi:hypothetical protein
MRDDDAGVDDERTASRAELLPEEKAAGSDNPQAQAEAILEESEERMGSREEAPGAPIERRRSEDTTPPV